MSKRPYDLRDFLSPIWRYSLSDKFKNNPDIQINQIILKAIDKQLNSVEDKTIASKADLYLKTARAEYLDYFGSWFGLERLNDKESDNHYRKRLINHIKHPRSTIPALRSAISAYLHTNMTKVHIYEPWQDVFLTNDYASRTNSRAHLFGSYYRPAVINIFIDTNFDPGVIDYINWFRPVGVVFLLTYENGNSDEASIWKMPAFHPIWHKSQLDTYIGFDSEERYDLNFLDKIDIYGKKPFYVSGISTPEASLFNSKYKNSGVPYNNYLPLSCLNSDSVLVDPIYFGKPYYSYLATLHSQMPISNNDTIDEMLLHSRVVNPDLYPNLNKDSGLTLTIKHTIPASNLLSHTEDLLGRWQYSNGTYLSGISDKGKSAVEFTNDHAKLAYTLSYQEATNDHGKANTNPFIAGHKYWISFDLRSTQSTDTFEVLVKLGKDQTLKLFKRVTPNNWVRCTQSFTYNGNPIHQISFQIKNISNSNHVYLSSSYLSSSSQSRWSPSYQDLGYPQSNSNSEYVYAFLNIWAFYFKYVESYTSVEQKLGINPSASQINQYISKQFDQKYFGLTYEPLVKDKLNTRFWFRNFDTGNWQNYASHLNIVGNHKDTYNFRFGSLLHLLNNQGMMAVALQVPAFHNNYKVKLYYLGLSFGQFHANEASIKIYKPYPNIELWWHIKTWHIFKWTNYNNYDMRSRAQAYYPIRYIRNYIRNVSYGHVDNKDFITNDSVLNGKKLIADYRQLFSKPRYYIKPYWDYSIIPSLTDNGNPVKSVSILGASCGDNYPTNRLNNLLKNSVFGYFSHPIWGHSSSVYMKKDINSEHVWFNNQGAKLWTSTDNIGSRNHYVLTFNARTRHSTALIKLKIELISNDYTQTLTKVIGISSKRHVYNVEFNTYGVFPDTVRFVWEFAGTDIERFMYLKHYKDTFTELKQDHYTFEYILNHMIPKSAKLPAEKVNSVTAFKHRPDITYMPSEPCYVYDPYNSNYLVPAPQESVDITDGWNFNGDLPEDYYPAMFKQNNKLTYGYVKKSSVDEATNSSKYLSLIPDGHGDYALGYNFAGNITNWIHAFIEDVASGNFVQCYGPKKFTYKVTPNDDTSEVMFRDISCHLMAKVNVDGKDTSHIPPQVNFKGQDTVAYNDVIFGQPVNENDLGETFGDLSRYQNTYSEFNQYGIDYEDLLDNMLLNDNDITWQKFAKNNITWQEAQNQEWLWEPIVQSDMLHDFELPKDNTTFYKLLEYGGPEIFDDLLHYKNDFNNFHVYHIDFADLLKHHYDEKDHAGKDYTFGYAKDNNWLFADGEPFDHKEHCVTIDLGRVYTNIDHLLVQHGSDSLPNAIYDSCVQTSIDGKHWHTWYDNYKGDKYPLDKPYVEPKEAPVAIPVAKYDCFNSKRDFNEDWKVPKANYVSSHLTHYPIKNLSSLLFNDDRKQASIYLQKYEQTDHYIIQVIPSLMQMLKYKLNQEYTDAYANNIGVPDDSEVNKMDNSSSLQVVSYQDNNNDTASHHYYPKVPIILKNKLGIPKVDQNNLTRQVFSTRQFQPAVHILGTDINYHPIDTTIDGWHRVNPNDVFYLNNKFSVLNGQKVLDGKPYKIPKYTQSPLKPNDNGKRTKQYKKYYKNIFYLNEPKSLLNSWYVLQDGYSIPKSIDKHAKNNASGTIPNPQYSYYNYDTSLLKFNLQNLLIQNYPHLYQNMQNNGINNPKQFAMSLLNTCSDIYISINGQINNTWSISVWDFKKHSWQRTVIKHSGGLAVLHLSHFNNYVNKGQMYVLVLANDLRTDDQPTIKLKSVNLKVVLNMDKVNGYHGGMYPHKNYEYNTNKLYSIPSTQHKQIIKVPWIYKDVSGHKVTVSFNLYSTTDTGKFNLKIGNLQSGLILVEKGYQAFHFIYDIPGRMKGKRRRDITPEFVIAPNNGDMKIYGLKAEIGVHLSPYVFPRN